ncbi:MAG TPA: hypothetical protein VEW07_01850, partial [Solirubrobacterales bacterium]|nr:hypothetical protein [Solirubrobacterales bacterium]
NSATATEVRQGLGRARIAGASQINVPRALNRAQEKVDRDGSHWSLTDTGRSYLGELLALAAPKAKAKAQRDVQTLKALAERVDDDAVRGYINEAVLCLEAGAFRAAIVFLWTGAVATIRDDVWHSERPKGIEDALKVHRPNARFRKKDDFAYVKDVDLLRLAADLGIYDKTQKQTLEASLGLRNGCGHPTKYNPGENKTSSFIEDIIGIVFT